MQGMKTRTPKVVPLKVTLNIGPYRILGILKKGPKTQPYNLKGPRRLPVRANGVGEVEGVAKQRPRTP